MLHSLGSAPAWEGSAPGSGGCICTGARFRTVGRKGHGTGGRGGLAGGYSPLSTGRGLRKMLKALGGAPALGLAPALRGAPALGGTPALVGRCTRHWRVLLHWGWIGAWHWGRSLPSAPPPPTLPCPPPPGTGGSPPVLGAVGHLPLPLAAQAFGWRDAFGPLDWGGVSFLGRATWGDELLTLRLRHAPWTRRVCVGGNWAAGKGLVGWLLVRD